MQGVLNPLSLIKAGVSASMNIATKAADGNGDASTDCLGFEYALVAIALGTVASGGNAKVVIKSSDDDGVDDSFAAITGAEYTLTGTDDNKLIVNEIRLSNNERYLRADYDETATGSSAVIGVWILPFGPKNSTSLGTHTGFSVV